MLNKQWRGSQKEKGKTCKQATYLGVIGVEHLF